MSKKILNPVLFLAIIFLSFLGAGTVIAATTPSLDSAYSYGILTEGTFTTTTTTINGNVGYTTLAGSPTINGIDDASNAAYNAAIIDKDSAKANLVGQSCDYSNAAAVDLFNDATHYTGSYSLGSLNVYFPGVYCITGAVSQTGDITLSGSGTFIFRTPAALSNAASVSVLLSNGAQSKDVFWVVDSAVTYGANAVSVGTYFGGTSVTTGAGFTLDKGRIFAPNITTTNTVITIPPASAPTAVAFTPAGGAVKAGTLNGLNTNLTAIATIVAGEATGGSAKLEVGGVLVSTDTTILAGDTSVIFDLGLSTTAGLQAAVAIGGTVIVELLNPGGSTASTISNPQLLVDYIAPTITSVTIPNVLMNVGDVITTTITTGTDIESYTLTSGTIGGFTLGALSKINNTTYEATFTILEGGTDVAPGSDIPVGNLILTDPALNPSAAYISPIAQAGDLIDANTPTITSVTIPNVSMYSGNTVTATITTSSDADTYTLTSGTIGGFTLGALSKINNTTYEATFTILEGGTDVAPGSDIPVGNLILTDPALNPSAAYISPIAQAGDLIDANTLGTTKTIEVFVFSSPLTMGVVSEVNKTIEVTVPFGTSLTSLVPTITIMGSSISPRTGIAQDFTSPFSYTVTATDASTQGYVVTVTVAANVTNTITFDGNTSNGGSTTSQTLSLSGTAPLSANGFTKTGHAFSGWNTLSNGSGTDHPNLSNYTMGSSNVTLFAQWDISSYTLTLDSDNGSSAQSITQDFGSTIIPPANPVKSGYIFSGWSPSLSATMPDANQTVVALWSVVVSSGGGSGGGGGGGGSSSNHRRSTITTPRKTISIITIPSAVQEVYTSPETLVFPGVSVSSPASPSGKQVIDGFFESMLQIPSIFNGDKGLAAKYLKRISLSLVLYMEEGGL